MASGSGGIDLLSVYNDEEEEEAEVEEKVPVEAAATAAVEEQWSGEADAPSSDPVADGGTCPTPPDVSFEDATSPTVGQIQSSPLDEGTKYETLISPIARSPTPPPLLPSRVQSSPFRVVSPSHPPLLPQASPLLPEPLDRPRKRMRSLAIVDYEHDDAAMSPDPEEEETLNIDHSMLGAEVQVPNGHADAGTPPGNVHVITPNTQLEPLHHSDLSDQPRDENNMPMDATETMTEVGTVTATVASVEEQKDDPLSSFLPPPSSAECPKELQERFSKFLAYKRAGKSFNADLRNRKDYRNPDFLQHAVRYQDIDQIGTCLRKDVFDPHGYDISDYVDEIENDMRREIERKEQERKKSQKVDLTASGIRSGTVVPTSNLTAQTSVAALPVAALNVLPSNPTPDGTTKDFRQNKKTKWDKIDGDVKSSTLSGAHENSSSVHAALLSATNAGGGYTAFADGVEHAPQYAITESYNKREEKRKKRCRVRESLTKDRNLMFSSLKDTSRVKIISAVWPSTARDRSFLVWNHRLHDLKVKSLQIYG